MKLTTDHNQRTTRKNLWADCIRTSILRGAFKPGEKLDQQLLTDEIGVSRSPVRKALRTLEAEGLILLVPNRGDSVTNLPLDDIKEHSFTRAVIEAHREDGRGASGDGVAAQPWVGRRARTQRVDGGELPAVRFTKVGRRFVHHRLDRQAAGRPVVVDHSLGTDLRIWDDVVPPPQAFLLSHYDLRGHGLSVSPDGPYSPTGRSDQLVVKGARAAVLGNVALLPECPTRSPSR